MKNKGYAKCGGGGGGQISCIMGNVEEAYYFSGMSSNYLPRLASL